MRYYLVTFKQACMNKMFIGYLLILTGFISCTRFEGPWADLYLEHPDKGFVSTVPAERKDDNLITGNGTIGALVPGNVEQDRILFSHELLYCPVYKPMPAPPVWEYMEKYREWIYNIEGNRAVKDIWDVGQKMGYPDPIWWTDSYIPSGYLVFDMPGTNASGGYARSTDWENGLTTVAWSDGKDIFHRKLFVSRASGTSVMQIESPTGALLDCNFWHEHLEIDTNSRQFWKDDLFFEENILSAETGIDGNILTFKMNFKKEWEGSLKEVNMLTRVIPAGGTIVENEGHLEVREAKTILLITMVQPDFERNGIPFSELYPKLNNSETEFKRLLSDHVAIHGEMFNRVEFMLDDEVAGTQTSEELIAENPLGTVSNAMMQRLFYASRYGSISSSGEYPPNLKGLWGTKWKAGWSGDMTQDGNVQSAIAAGLSGNHFEIMRTYLDYMTGFINDFRKNANDLYNIDGIWVPSKTSNDGKVYHFSWRGENGFPGLFWPAGAAWTSQFYYDYWLYTADEEFLRKQAIPFMDGSARFYEQYLSERDGKYEVNPSYSPEIAPLDISTSVLPNATMDIASIKQLLRNMLSLAEKGLIDPEQSRIDLWERIIANLPSYDVGADGGFKEWIWPGIENNNAHRHCSHFYPLFYELDPEIDTSEMLRTACTKAIEDRLDYRKEIKGGTMAYGLYFLGVSAAHLGNARQAYECLDMLASRYWTASLASTHNPNNMMNMDISGGYPSLVIEMLMYSRNEFIELLPALPAQWPSGKITGLRAKGGFEVDIYWKDGKLERAEFTSLLGNSLSIKHGEKKYDLNLSRGDTYTFTP
jgi:alpha-L-fucosidase 2